MPFHHCLLSPGNVRTHHPRAQGGAKAPGDGGHAVFCSNTLSKPFLVFVNEPMLIAITVYMAVARFFGVRKDVRE